MRKKTNSGLCRKCYYKSRWNYCIDCGKRIKGKKTTRCWKCYRKFKNLTKKLYNCIDCGTIIGRRAVRCVKCAAKIKGLKLRKKFNKCIDCGKIINRKHKRCKKCYLIFSNKNKKEFYCIDCGKKISYGSKRCFICWHKFSRGKNNPNYIHGLGSSKYTNEFKHKLRLEIRKRDNYTCQNCNMTEEEHLSIVGKTLPVHHIDYNRKNNEEFNLITLCNWCNLRANKNREDWNKYYREKMEEIYGKQV